MTKFIKNYDKDGEPRRSIKYYEKRLKEFQSQWDDFKKKDMEIVAMKIADASSVKGKASQYFDDDVYSVVEELFINHYARIEERFQKEYPPLSKTIESEEHSHHEETITRFHKDDSVKLPKISLEKFTGDYRKWTTFHDLFKTLIHENRSISAVQKLQYLKLHLGGEAEQLLRHFQITDVNYKIAWEMLENRYDNKRVLVNAQLKLLLSQNSVSNESSHGVKNLLDITAECLQALKNLEIDTTTWDPLIVYLIVQRLPPETHQLWEQSLNTQREVPKWKELQDFLEGRFRTLEAIATKRGQGPTTYNKYHRPSGSRNVSQSFHVTIKLTCCICLNNHSIRQCPRFLEMSDMSKLETVKQRGLCMNCLGQGHMSLNCPSRLRCIHCQGRHHSLLHRKEISKNRSTDERMQSINTHVFQNKDNKISATAIPPALSASAADFAPKPGTSHGEVNSYVVSGVPHNHQILLATALVTVISQSGRRHILRALIDQGSQASFITETAVQDLQLPKESIRACVSGLGQTTSGHISARVHINLRHRNKDNLSINASAFVLQKLTQVLPSKAILTSNWEHISGLDLADPSYNRPGKIDLLLGADVYGQIILQGLLKGGHGEPIAQKTVFGWILSGEINDVRPPLLEIRNFHITTELDRLLKLLWELEATSEDRILTQEEIKCEEHFTATVKRNSDGRYVVSLPFVEDDKEVMIGKSRDVATARLFQMENRFKKDPSLKAQYSACLQEYLELGHMKAIESTEEDHLIVKDKQHLYSCCYLPHHAVIKESSSTTKVRVVFDASSETANRKSLNDLLMKGPIIQDELSALTTSLAKASDSIYI